MKTGCLGHRKSPAALGRGTDRAGDLRLTNPWRPWSRRTQLKNLRGCEAHFSVIISEEDIKLYKRLGINVSCEAI